MTEKSKATSRGTPLRFKAHHLLALVPLFAILAGVPYANRVEPIVLGLPFLLFWIVLWVVLTSVCMGVIYYLDQPREADSAVPDEDRGS